MILRPPRSTRTDTPFPAPPLVRSTPVVQTVGGPANTVTATVAPTAGTTVLAPVAGLVNTTTATVNQVLSPVTASTTGTAGGALAPVDRKSTRLNSSH